ncbi:uncharacterized protein LOC114186154 [Vigna unguiculata]|uniref:Calmodulin-binding domain-containing protein n=1 Tax=Vigna unguiculata TaxID=3917 RepID=A0A4D6NG17_VIGUN|nr:uncharacterized protein LOC114186154 [Vigna unguiculata]QCE12626.1 hypothetical protein DEO72_LG10g3873 [Vigna unguiculata]
MSSGAKLRRHSDGIARSGNDERKVVVPRYLRASIGSCHDFCKYGRMNVEEAKETLSMLKRAGRKSLSRSSDNSIGGITISVAKQKASLDSKPTQMSKVKISSSSEGEIPSKPTSIRVESSPAAISQRVKTHPKLTSKIVKASSKSMSTMKQASPKVSSSEDKEVQLSEKHATPMKTTSSMNSSEGLGGQRISKIKLRKRKNSPRSSPGGIGSVSARKHKGLKIVPHLMIMNQPAIEVEPEEHNKEAQEKTLYVIKMESANQSSQSDQNESQEIESPLSNSLSPSSISLTSPQEDQEESEYANTESEEDVPPQNHEFEYQANVDTLEAEENGRHQKDVEVAFSEDKDCQKLSGELAETQIDEDNLKSLERGKVLRDNATDESAARTGPEMVVLRPEDEKEKKDEEELYNNVIEATASKLVEEGKVKALIDAFENIISLEEKRTLANIFN